MYLRFREIRGLYSFALLFLQTLRSTRVIEDNLEINYNAAQTQFSLNEGFPGIFFRTVKNYKLLDKRKVVVVCY